ncbi:hypothetical protein LX36DRAFT_660534, partial [Colletotrichum falcatum]
MHHVAWARSGVSIPAILSFVHSFLPRPCDVRCCCMKLLAHPWSQFPLGLDGRDDVTVEEHETLADRKDSSCPTMPGPGLLLHGEEHHDCPVRQSLKTQGAGPMALVWKRGSGRVPSFLLSKQMPLLPFGPGGDFIISELVHVGKLPTCTGLPALLLDTYLYTTYLG